LEAFKAKIFFFKSNSNPTITTQLNSIPAKIGSNFHENFQESIAIIGMSGRFPGANNVEEYWESLLNGIDGITTCPLNRPYMYSGKSREKVIQAGYLKCRIDEFDAQFFGISPREAHFHDPQERLLLEVTWESLENAGINPISLRGSNTAVYSGIACDDYKHIIKDVALKTDSVLYGYVGNAFSSVSSRISYFLGLHGPNIALESACSSSFLGLHLACQSLQLGETNLAITGGVNVILSSDYALGDGNTIF
jgi:acyl transferase domain-containing protein